MLLNEFIEFNVIQTFLKLLIHNLIYVQKQKTKKIMNFKLSNAFI